MKENIQDLDLFYKFSEKEIFTLLDIHQVIHFKKDQVIIEESNIEFDFYLLISGEVSVEMSKAEDSSSINKKQITTLAPGESFGEITFLEGMRRSATIRALSDVTVMRFDGEKLYSILENEKKICYLFMKNLATILSRRVRDLNEKWINQC